MRNGKKIAGGIVFCKEYAKKGMKKGKNRKIWLVFRRCDGG